MILCFYIDENYINTKVIDSNIIDEVNGYRKEFENEIKGSEKTKDNNEDLTRVFKSESTNDRGSEETKDNNKDLTRVFKSKSINTQGINNTQLVKNLSNLGKK